MHTIDRILAAASAELRAIGIGGFRSRSVAESAKVSLGTLTHYFPTKENLVDALLSVFLRPAWQNWNSQAENISEAGLGPIVAGFYELCSKHQSVVRVIVHLSARDGAAWGATTTGILRPLLDDVERRLGRDKRLLAHTVVSSAMIYAIYEDEQLCAITGESSIKDARASVLRHLQGLANG